MLAFSYDTNPENILCFENNPADILCFEANTANIFCFLSILTGHRGGQCEALHILQWHKLSQVASPFP